MASTDPEPATLDRGSEPGLAERLAAEVPHLRRLVERLGVRGEAAEDLCQDVLARALRYRAAFDPAGSLRGWLARTAARASVDWHRRAARAPEDLGERAEEITDEGRDEAAGIDEREELERMLRGLGEREREVLWRFHGRAESVAEIAAALALPEGTVKSHLHRARRKLAGREGEGS